MILARHVRPHHLLRAAALAGTAALAFACGGHETPPAATPGGAPSVVLAEPTTPAPRLPIDLFTDEVGVVGASGKGRRTVATTGEVVDGIAWLPDGRLSFVTETDDVIKGEMRQRGHVYVEPIGGGTPAVFYESDNPLAVAWSPDGLWAAIHRTAFRTYETPGLVLESTDGDRSIELGELKSPGVWLPDGRYAFVSGGQLLIGDPQSDKKACCDSASLMGTPQPSPDGSRLIIRTTDGTFTIADLESGTLLPQSKPDVGIPPRWSPDGTRVLYATGVGVGKLDPKVWIYDVPSGQSSLLESGMQFIDGYDWSPGGQRVALTVHHGDDAGLYLVTVATGARTRILQRTNMSEVAWSRDDGSIAVSENGCWSSCEPGPSGVLLVSEDGAAVESSPGRTSRSASGTAARQSSGAARQSNPRPATVWRRNSMA